MVSWISRKQPSQAFKARCFRAHSSGGVLKMVVLCVGLTSFVSKGEARSQEFLPDCKLLFWGQNLWWEPVSTFPTCFDEGICSLTWCVSYSASFWMSFRGNCSMCSYTLGVSVRGSSGVCCVPTRQTVNAFILIMKENKSGIVIIFIIYYTYQSIWHCFHCMWVLHFLKNTKNDNAV